MKYLIASLTRTYSIVTVLESIIWTTVSLYFKRFTDAWRPVAFTFAFHTLHQQNGWNTLIKTYHNLKTTQDPRRKSLTGRLRCRNFWNWLAPMQSLFLKKRELMINILTLFILWRNLSPRRMMKLNLNLKIVKLENVTDKNYVVIELEILIKM